MVPLEVSLDGTGAWQDLQTRDVVEGEWGRISYMPGGMTSGNASIGICIELPDGRPCFAQTSWQLLYTAVKAMEARHGAPWPGLP